MTSDGMKIEKYSVCFVVEHIAHYDTFDSVIELRREAEMWKVTHKERKTRSNMRETALAANGIFWMLTIHFPCESMKWHTKLFFAVLSVCCFERIQGSSMDFAVVRIKRSQLLLLSDKVSIEMNRRSDNELFSIYTWQLRFPCIH